MAESEPGKLGCACVCLCVRGGVRRAKRGKVVAPHIMPLSSENAESQGTDWGAAAAAEARSTMAVDARLRAVMA